MLSWLKTIFSGPGFYQYPDTFGFRQSAIDKAICQAVRARQSHGDLILVVSHFPETFSRSLEFLDAQQLDVSVETSQLGPNWIRDRIDQSAGKPLPIYPVLAQRLDPSSLANTAEQPKSTNRIGQISLIVTERHPKLEVDERIVRFAEQCELPAKLGYYLSFEQPLIKHCFGEMGQQLLRNWNSKDEHVFGSSLAAGRIRSVLKRKFREAEISPDADSVNRWFEANNIELSDS